MKSLFAPVLFAGLLVMAGSVTAHEMHSGAHEGAVKTLTGELVDTGCYLQHAAHGEKHVSCASKCIANGMPMGLLTADGSLYLITLNHDNGDPYNKLKDMAGKRVKVTGTVMVRNGMKGIDVTDAALATAVTK
jgi:hypothetical protein